MKTYTKGNPSKPRSDNKSLGKGQSLLTDGLEGTMKSSGLRPKMTEARITSGGGFKGTNRLFSGLIDRIIAKLELDKDLREKLAREGLLKKPHRMEHEKGMKSKEFGLTRIPHGFRGNERNQGILRGNRFLAIQEGRIRKAVKQGNLAKATLIGLMVLKLSKSYQLALFNKVIPNGYGKLPLKVAENILRKASNKCRRMDLTMNMQRFYITKLNGKKRPIGKPSFPSRILCKGVNNMVYGITSETRMNFQHGYRHERGCGTALIEVIDYLRMGYTCYEFDLKSFFNTVPVTEIKTQLKKVGGKLISDLVFKILVNIEYQIPKTGLEPEKELQIYGGKKFKNKEIPIIQRSGIPQGLTLSPVVSTLVLEAFSPPKDLVMYADDGLFFHKGDKIEFEEGLYNLEQRGIALSEEKSMDVNRNFKFLGAFIDIKKEEIMFKDQDGNNHTISGHDENLNVGLKKAANFYGPDRDEGDGVISKESGIETLSKPHKLNGLEMLITGWQSYIFASNPYKGYRCFPSGADPEESVINLGPWKFYDISGSSSEGCAYLLEKIKGYKLSKYKKMDLNDVIRNTRSIKPKGYYKDMNMNSVGRSYDATLDWSTEYGMKRSMFDGKIELDPYAHLMNKRTGYFEILPSSAQFKISHAAKSMLRY